jgi:hypothetical protein
MKVFAYCTLVLSGLLVLLWPVAAFSSIFLFDAPNGTFYFEVQRYALAIGILSYPRGFLVAIARIIARKKGQGWWNGLTIGFLLARSRNWPWCICSSRFSATERDPGEHSNCLQFCFSLPA